MRAETGRVAILWRGDREARRTASPQTSRFHRVFEALQLLGIEAEPAIFGEAMVDEVRDQLLGMNGVLVWVDPLSDEQTRAVLDPLLREVASHGVWVSAHPDIIMKMGVKEVLHRTRHLGWGTDTHLYRSMEMFRKEFPSRLAGAGTRVLKRNRGNGGQGVWKVEPGATSTNRPTVRVLEARRGSLPRELALSQFAETFAEYFEKDGCVIDQPFQARLPEGMIRCYVGGDRVVGFGHQLIKALLPPPPEGPDAPSAQPGPRIMHPKSAPEFRRLRAQMETEWIPGMAKLLEIDRRDLPVIWDADFLYGPRTDDGEDSYVLCEINVSSVFPIPEQAPEEIARLVEDRCGL